MSLIPHTFFPRRMFDVDTWMPSTMGGLGSAMSPLASTLMPSTLDVFDPFDELDRMMSRNLRWINRPESMLPSGLQALMPTVPHKYRITIDAAGFSPESIKTEMKDVNGRHHIIVHAQEESGAGEQFHKREFKRSYTLPRNAIHDQMVSFMTPSGQFIMEFPLAETTTGMGMSLLPQITDLPEGGKGVSLNLNLPPNMDPSKVQVSVKDRDVIVKLDDETVTPDRMSRVHFYSRTTLPENTDFRNLKCVQNQNQLTIQAPISSEMGYNWRNIPIEKAGQQQQMLGSSQQQQQQQQSY